MQITQTTDAKLIAQMHRIFHDSHVELHPTIFKPFDEVAMTSAFQALVNEPQHSFYILQHDEEAIGYAWVEWREQQETAFKFGETTMYIHQISIEDPYRGQGNGKLLLDYVTDIAKSRSVSRIELDYWLTNFGAKYFYRKHDFIPYNERVYKELS